MKAKIVGVIVALFVLGAVAPLFAASYLLAKSFTSAEDSGVIVALLSVGALGSVACSSDDPGDTAPPASSSSNGRASFRRMSEPNIHHSNAHSSRHSYLNRVKKPFPAWCACPLPGHSAPLPTRLLRGPFSVVRRLTSTRKSAQGRFSGALDGRAGAMERPRLLLIDAPEVGQGDFGGTSAG